MLDIINRIEERLAKMKVTVEEIEKTAGALHADFYRAHYEGCVKLCEMGKKFKEADGEERERLRKEVEQLAVSLNESLQLLRIHNTN